MQLKQFLVGCQVGWDGELKNYRSRNIDLKRAWSGLDISVRVKESAWVDLGTIFRDDLGGFGFPPHSPTKLMAVHIPQKAHGGS